MTGALYLGLDVGTQGTKGLVICRDQQSILARSSRSYGLIEGLVAGAAEQHPATWIDAVGAVVAELLLSPDVDPNRVTGIGVSGQQHGFVALDEQGEVLRPAKLWCDTSTAVEAKELSEQFGHAVPTGFTASKILWLKRHEPDHFERLAQVLLPHDYLNYRLTGELCMEAGDASGTGFFDPRTRTFCKEEMLQIDERLPDLLPPLIEAGAPAGRLTETAAGWLGLRAGTLVSTGGGDNMMSAFGSGATREGVAVMSLGTSGTVFCHSTQPVLDPQGLIAPFCDSTGGWLPLLCVMNVTGVTEEVRSLSGGTDLERLTRAASQVEPGCGGLLFVPYLQGERVPDLPDASGTLLGVRPGSLTPGRLFRAALEGTSLNLAWGVQRMRALGLPIEHVRLVGGGAHNPLWRQILADLLNVPVQRLEEPESAALGAALSAAWTAERAVDPALRADTVAQGFTRYSGPSEEPDPGRSRAYQHLLEQFQERVATLYP